jgi:prepilin-type N-terminal cleavage/methylation domain-containing protein
MNKRKGFTLVEVIVVIAAIGIVLPALFAILFSLLKQQIKIYQLSEVKRQGDYALSIMDSTIRQNALSLYESTNTTPICANAGDTNVPVGFFRDEGNRYFRYVLSSNKVASQSEIIGATTDLTTNRVTISNLVVECSKTARYSAPIITLQFTVTAGTAASPTEQRARMTYRTRIQLRNY